LNKTENSIYATAVNITMNNSAKLLMWFVSYYPFTAPKVNPRRLEGTILHIYYRQNNTLGQLTSRGKQPSTPRYPGAPVQ